MPIVIDPPEAPPLEPPLDDGSMLWEELYNSLGYHRATDPATGYALRKFCEAWCAPLQPIHDLVRERPGVPAWGILFDPDLCPAESLPYPAQWVGVAVTPEMSEEQLRDEIREPTGWKRGQPQALRIATRRTLIGEDPLAIIRPRTPEPGRHYIRTLLSQTPDPARTEAVLLEELPAWEILDYEAIEGVKFADIAAGWDVFGDLAAAHPTFKDLAEVLPTELPK
ncbi:MAG TPA: phage tail protein [Solirubrobacterales bacterium]|nr:phage tail protein [Solirubrobacterales bacterium]